MSCDAVIFDLYGTLVQNFSFSKHEKVMSGMSEALGLAHDRFVSLWDEAFPGQHTGAFASIEANLEHICQSAGTKQETKRIASAAKVRLDFAEQSLVPRPNSIETLVRLKDRGYKIGLISDCAPDVPLLWERTPFAPLIDSSVFSCQVGVKKPDVRIYKLACERLGVTADKCLYVGDGSSRELTGATEAGMRAVLFRISLEDTYDSQREDVLNWKGLEITRPEDILDLVSKY